MPCDERFELGAEASVPAERELGIDPVLDRCKTQLGQAPPLALREQPRRQVVERRPTPERKRLLEQNERPFELAAAERIARLAREPLEAVQIDVVVGDAQHVAGRGRLHALGPDDLAELRDVPVQRRGRGLGRLAAPDELDQPLARHDLVRMHEERREERALPGAAERERLPTGDDLQRPEDAEFHAFRRFWHGGRVSSENPPFCSAF